MKHSVLCPSPSSSSSCRRTGVRTACSNGVTDLHPLCVAGDTVAFSGRTAPTVNAAIHETAAWAALKEHAASLQGAHLRDMMRDADRCAALTAERDGVLLDYSRQRVTNETMVSYTLE